MVLFITYLRPSLQKEKKNKAMKSTKQNAVKADYHWLAIPICLAFKTVYYSAQHFLNFRQTTSLPPSQPSLATTTNLGYPHRKSKQQQTQQQQVHTERMEFGRGLNNWSCPALYRNYRNGRRNTTTNHYYKNTNVIMIVFCCLILFFFDKFRV